MPQPLATSLILGANGAIGGYLARLLGARGTRVWATVDPALPGPDALATLGIADDVTRIDSDDAAALAASGAVAAIFAVAGDDAQAMRIADVVAAAAGSGRPLQLVHVADAARLQTSRASLAVARAVVAAREGGRLCASNALLGPHDSRLGPPGSLPAAITLAALGASRGVAAAPLELVETGPVDWGWTAEYVDAVQRIAALATPRDLMVASGHAMTTAEFVAHAFKFFAVEPADHIRIVGDTTEPADPGFATAAAALKAATGWSATTVGADLVRALCEGAADRAG